MVGCNRKWESLLEKSKQKRHGFHGFVNKFSVMYWGRRLYTMGAEMLYEELSGTVIGAAMEVHKLLGSGFLESVYERARALALTGRQIPLERQAPITVM